MNWKHAFNSTFGAPAVAASIALAVLLAVVAAVSALIAENTGVALGATQVLTGPDGVCRQITNNSATGRPVYIPASSSAEWQSFVANPPAGVTVGSCGCFPQVVNWSGTNAICSQAVVALTEGESTLVSVSTSYPSTVVQRVYTNTLTASGRWLGTWDDYRGDARGVTIDMGAASVCARAGFVSAVVPASYACAPGPRYTESCHNGPCGYYDYTGEGWCADTGLHWVDCNAPYAPPNPPSGSGSVTVTCNSGTLSQSGASCVAHDTWVRNSRCTGSFSFKPVLSPFFYQITLADVAVWSNQLRNTCIETTSTDGIYVYWDYSNPVVINGFTGNTTAYDPDPNKWTITSPTGNSLSCGAMNYVGPLKYPGMGSGNDYVVLANTANNSLATNAEACRVTCQQYLRAGKECLWEQVFQQCEFSSRPDHTQYDFQYSESICQ